MKDRSPRAFEAHPRNADGPFYVVRDECIACEAPEAEAPDLMAHVSDHQTSYHCYFYRQPESSEETHRATEAVIVSCCGAVRYGGTDPEILERLVEHRCGDQCDALIPPASSHHIAPPEPPRPAAPPDRTHPLWDRDLDA